MSDHHIRTSCRLCSAEALELVLDLGETALANEVVDDPNEPQDTFPLRLMKCGECGHRMLDFVVDPERLYREYVYTSGLSSTYRAHLQDYARQIAPGLDSGDLLVEVGGNDGTLGAAFDYSEGLLYVNIDPSDAEQRYGERVKDFFGLDVAKQIRSEHGLAKAVVANHVFAHHDGIHDMADGVRQLLADDGEAWIEVGNGPEQLSRRDGVQYLYHEHCSIHDFDSFAAFWKRHGLAVKHASTNHAQGSSLRMCLVHDKPGFVPMQQLGGAKWDDAKLVANVRRLKRAGEYVKSMPRAAAFGAPARMTPLMAAMGLGRDDIEVVFDDNPRKVGKYTPGHHIPIRPAEELDDSAIGFCLNFCPGFDQEIKRRRSAYGGLWLSLS